MPASSPARPAAGPRPLELSVLLTQPGDDPDQLAGLLGRLSSGHGGHGGGTTLPTPLSFERVIRGHLAAFEGSNLGGGRGARIRDCPLSWAGFRGAVWSCDQIGPVTLTRVHPAQRGPFSALGLADSAWRVCRSVEQRLASRRDDVGSLRRRCTGLLKLDAPDEVVQPTGPIGRAWTRHPVTRPVQPRYEWLYLYAFVCPESGASQFRPVPEVTKRAYQPTTAAFAASLGGGQTITFCSLKMARDFMSLRWRAIPLAWKR
ncbi:RNaseH domain-containing protein [Deinococcus radiopugnans]|uniref:RNaseH domain-containing protein n=1 Tax=Deinococcus radiopugnans TaxID=57497 RepID=UPI003613A2ED